MVAHEICYLYALLGDLLWGSAYQRTSTLVLILEQMIAWHFELQGYVEQLGAYGTVKHPRIWGPSRQHMRTISWNTISI